MIVENNTPSLLNGEVIEVTNLKVQTTVAPEIYTGKLTVIGKRDKGQLSPLVVFGKRELVNDDTYYIFTQGDTEMTCTTPLKRLLPFLYTKP